MCVRERERVRKNEVIEKEREERKREMERERDWKMGYQTARSQDLPAVLALKLKPEGRCLSGPTGSYLRYERYIAARLFLFRSPAPLVPPRVEDKRYC